MKHPYTARKKYTLHQKQGAYRHSETVKKRPRGLPNSIYTARFSEPLHLTRMLVTEKHYNLIIDVPQKTACVSGKGRELGLILLQPQHSSITGQNVTSVSYEMSHTGPSSGSAMHCKRTIALNCMRPGASPREPADTNCPQHFFICSVSSTLTYRKSKHRLFGDLHSTKI